MKAKVLTSMLVASALVTALAWAQAPGTAGLGPQGEKSMAPGKAPRAGMHMMHGPGAGAGARTPGQAMHEGGCCGACAMGGAGMRPGRGRGMMGHGRGMGMGRGAGVGGRGAGPAMMRELDLSAAQRDKAADIHERAMKKTIQARADLATARLDLHKLMRSDKPDARLIDAQIDRMAALRGSIQKAHTGAMLEMRSMLTPEQRKKFEQLHMNGPQGPGMGRGMGGRMGWDLDDMDDDEGVEG
jgi:Spy/CpxP family protein refolding chaperone